MVATVLLVEDDPDLLNTYALSLTKSGFNVITASDGTELASIVATNTVDIIVSDTNLPTLDGDIACKRVISQGHLSRALIIAMSSDRDAEQYWTGTAHEFLYKGGITNLGTAIRYRYERFLAGSLLRT
jgi:DNA-binding response OmpR family regulator